MRNTTWVLKYLLLTWITSFLQKIISSVRESLTNNLVLTHLSQHKSIIESYPNSTSSAAVLLLAVSGGCDSVALFHSVLALTRQPTSHDNYNDARLSKQDNTRKVRARCLYLDSDDGKSLLRIPCELYVAHFNHEQRGENSDEDEALVRSLCNEANVPFYCYSWSDMTNDGSSVATTNLSTFSQDVARKWRRSQMIDLLTSLVNDTNYNNSKANRWGAILTAHHRDDAEETVLLKLLRGAHITNLSGMEERSEGFELNAPNNNHTIGYFAKPLLGVRKGDILDYLTRHGYAWREDESNSKNKYKRNMVRNQLIPLLCEIAGGEDALHVSCYMNDLNIVLNSPLCQPRFCRKDFTTWSNKARSYHLI